MTVVLISAMFAEVSGDLTIEAQSAPSPRPLYSHLYVQVLAAIALGVMLGYVRPDIAVSLKPLSDGFIRLIKMGIAPIIFCTVVHGIASTHDVKSVGRVGLKALIYFEAVTTLALLIGLVVVNLFRPGSGMNIDPAKLNTAQVSSYVAQSSEQSVSQFFLHIIPESVVGAFAQNEMIQVLFFAVLFAVGLQRLGEKGRGVVQSIDVIAEALFAVIGIVMRLAPLGALGAMAFTVGAYGIGSLTSLVYFMGTFYLTCLLFLFVVLGAIAQLTGFSLLRFIAYIKEELLIVLGTSSSEPALPRLITKLRALGCKDSIVALVVPTGYSFNLDGTCIYLTMAAVFLAQATNTDLTIWHQITILAILLLTSKGAAGVTGSGFIVLAATLSSVGHIPVASIALILGIDRFMSEARALTNLIGNGVATIVVAKWEQGLDEEKLHAELRSTRRRA